MAREAFATKNLFSESTSKEFTKRLIKVMYEVGLVCYVEQTMGSTKEEEKMPSQRGHGGEWTAYTGHRRCVISKC